MVLLDRRQFRGFRATKKSSAIYRRRLENRDQLWTHSASRGEGTLHEIAEEIAHDPINCR